jgi:hypothetical protein
MTVKTAVKWNRNRDNFYTDNFDGCFVSYNSDTSRVLGGLGVGDILEETALVDSRRRYQGCKYLILNGDYRKQYEERLPHGFEACLTFYLSEAEKEGKRSSWEQ